MTAGALAAALAFGVVGGVLAGLVGIGGGVVLVPFLYLVLDHPAWSGVLVPAERVTIVAHATSLAVIIPTAASALRSFGRANLVPWRAVAWMGAAAAVAAAATTRLAPSVPGQALRAGFAAFLIVVGIRLFVRPSPERAARAGAGDERPLLGVIGGLAVGVFSALLGVGGGLVAVPLLIFAFHMDLRRVAAASMGVVACAAVAGAAGYLLSRPGLALPAGTVGWVHVPLALALMPGAVVGARVGARWNQRLAAERLRQVFAVVLVLLGLRLGVSAARAWGDAYNERGPSDHAGAPAVRVS